MVLNDISGWKAKLSAVEMHQNSSEERWRIKETPSQIFTLNIEYVLNEKKQNMFDLQLISY